MPESVSRSYCIAADHPCFAGHFPGNPIVPGVVLLDYIKDLLEEWKPGQRIIAIAYAKFHHPLRPGQKFTVQLAVKNPDTVKFECFHGQLKLASGIVNLAELT